MGEEQRPRSKQPLVTLGDSKEASVARTHRVKRRLFGDKVKIFGGVPKGLCRTVEDFGFPLSKMGSC